MKALIILLLSCAAALGQSPLLTGSGIDWTIPAAASIPDPSTVPGLQYWFHGSDPSNGVISSWTDKISSFVVQNTQVSLRPTADSATKAVVFNGTTYLTNFNISSGMGGHSNSTMVLCLSFDNVNETGSRAGVFDDTSDNITYGINGGNPAIFNLNGGTWFKTALSQKIDIYITVWDFDATQVKVSTNNVVFLSSVGRSANLHWGGIAGTLESLKHAQFHLYDLLWYTNNIVTNSAWTTTVHTYLTNRYGFSP